MSITSKNPFRVCLAAKNPESFQVTQWIEINVIFSLITVKNAPCKIESLQQNGIKVIGIHAWLIAKNPIDKTNFGKKFFNQIEKLPL